MRRASWTLLLAVATLAPGCVTGGSTTPTPPPPGASILQRAESLTLPAGDGWVAAVFTLEAASWRDAGGSSSFDLVMVPGPARAAANASLLYRVTASGLQPVFAGASLAWHVGASMPEAEDVTFVLVVAAEGLDAPATLVVGLADASGDPGAPTRAMPSWSGGGARVSVFDEAFLADAPPRRASHGVDAEDARSPLPAQGAAGPGRLALALRHEGEGLHLVEVAGGAAGQRVGACRLVATLGGAETRRERSLLDAAQFSGRAMGVGNGVDAALEVETTAPDALPWLSLVAVSVPWTGSEAGLHVEARVELR